MSAADHEPALPGPVRAAMNPSSPMAADTSLLSDRLVASSPVMKDLGLEPPRFPSQDANRDSRASSFRLSKDLNNLKWDGAQLREGARQEEETHEPDSEADIEQGDSDGQQSGLEQTNPVTYSTLSKRADFILANAKKKLNLLEGNLGRARHSLMENPQALAERRSSSSLSHYHMSGSLDEDGQSISQGPRQRLGPRINFGAPRSQRDSVANVRKASNSGHSRMFSDTSVPSPTGASIKGSRSLDYMRNGNDLSHRPLREASSFESSGNSSNTSLNPVLEDEDQYDEPPLPESRVQQQRTSILAIRELYGHSSSSTPRTTQDLRDQAEELRSRIAFLQKRSRDDRSRDSFNNNPLAERDEQAFLTQVQALERSLEDQEQVILQLENAERDNEDMEQDPRSEWQQVLRKNEEERDDGSEGNSEDMYDGYEFEDGEVPDALEGEDFDETKTMDGAHEDRADAFDYEHFILHSVMGRLNPSSPSGSDTGSEGPEDDEEDEFERAADARSQGSGSTERAVGGEEKAQRPWERLRHPNESQASLATTQSFETAQERGDSESDDDGSYSSDPSHGQLLHSDGLQGMWPMPPNNERDIDADGEAATPTASSFPRPGGLSPGARALQSDDRGTPIDPRRRPTSTVFSVLMKPDSETAAMIPGPIGSQDTALVRQVVESLRGLCLELHQAGANPRELKALRERLEVCKRVLNGEL